MNYLYNIIYKTTNTRNSKFYIGKHQTNDLNDNYLGSGTILLKAIKKYGRQNFIREVLHFCDSNEELNRLEIELLTEEILNDSLCYNIAYGGQGGCIVLKKDHPKYKETCRKISIAQKARLKNKKNHPMYGKKGELNPNYGKPSWNKGKKCPQLSGSNNGMYGKVGKDNPNYNRIHTNKSKENMRAGQLKGEKSQNVKKRKKIRLTFKCGRTITIVGIAKFARESGGKYVQSGISSLLTKKIKTYKDIISADDCDR